MSKVGFSGLILPLIIQGYLSLFVFGFVDNARGPYFPDIIADLNLSDSRAAWFFGATSTVALVGSQITPWVLRLVSLQTTLNLSLILLGASLFGLTFVREFWQMALATSTMGIFFGLINVTQNLCIQFGAPEEVRPRLFSGLHSMYALSSLLAPLMIAALSFAGFGWRNGFQMFAFIIAAAGVVSFFLKSNAVYEPKTKLQEQSAVGNYSWKVIVLAFCMAFYIAGELSLSSRLVLHLRRSLDYSVEEASVLLSAFFGLLFIGRVASAFIKLKASQLQSIVFYSLVTSLFLYAMGLMINEWFLPIVGLSMAPFFGTYLAYLGKVLKDQVVKAMSIALAAGTLTVVPMHILIGELTDRYGLNSALWVGPGCLLISLVLFVEFNRRVKI